MRQDGDSDSDLDSEGYHGHGEGGVGQRALGRGGLGSSLRFGPNKVGNVVRPSYIDESTMTGMSRTEMLQVKKKKQEEREERRETFCAHSYCLPKP